MLTYRLVTVLLIMMVHSIYAAEDDDDNRYLNAMITSKMEKQQLLRVCNRNRQQAGMSTVTWSSKLEEQAMQMAVTCPKPESTPVQGSTVEIRGSGTSQGMSPAGFESIQKVGCAKAVCSQVLGADYGAGIVLVCIYGNAVDQIISDDSPPSPPSPDYVTSHEQHHELYHHGITPGSNPATPPGIGRQSRPSYMTGASVTNGAQSGQPGSSSYLTQQPSRPAAPLFSSQAPTPSRQIAQPWGSTSDSTYMSAGQRPGSTSDVTRRPGLTDTTSTGPSYVSSPSSSQQRRPAFTGSSNPSSGSVSGTADCNDAGSAPASSTSGWQPGSPGLGGQSPGGMSASSMHDELILDGIPVITN